MGESLPTLSNGSAPSVGWHEAKHATARNPVMIFMIPYGYCNNLAASMTM